jgi:inorganic triphosphatase YgiF
MGGMETGHLETERKYDADPDFAMPDFRSVPECAGVSAPERYQLSATYFDTEDMRLAARSVTLRRRTGGSDEGWHLKLPVRPGTRREVHVPLSAVTGAVPQRLEALVAEITEGMPLHPIGVVETIRTVRRLTGPAGEVLAEVADDLVTARRSGPPARQDNLLRWREIEVEIVTAQPGLLESADKLLREAGARPSKASSKLGRLLSTEN